MAARGGLELLTGASADLGTSAAKMPLFRDRVGKSIAYLMNDLLPDFVFGEFGIGCCSGAPRLKDLGLLLE